MALALGPVSGESLQRVGLPGEARVLPQGVLPGPAARPHVEVNYSRALSRPRSFTLGKDVYAEKGMTDFLCSP